MSTTNIQIITSAFRKVNAIDETQSPSAEQGVVGLELLNDMMLDWAADGVQLGWYTQTDLSATAPIDDENVRGVKLLLAGEIALHYGFTVSPTLANDMNTAWASLVKRATKYTESDLGELSRSQANAWGTGGGF